MIVSFTNELLPRHKQLIYQNTSEEVHILPSIDRIQEGIAQKAEILITFGNDLTEEYINRFSKLKWIQVFSAGIEDLPFKAIQKKGILVTNVSGIHVKPMSEYVLYCLLHFEKDMERYQVLKKEKKYDRTKLVGELSGREVLIYGTGSIGQGVAKVLDFMGSKVFGVNTNGKNVPYFTKTYSMENAIERLKRVDYVISILPSTTKTHSLFNQEYLSNMKKDAVFINIGRGDTVNEEAIFLMLKNKKLKGAALDVFQKEPLPLSSKLWDCDNLILTPHMSAKSIYYIDRCVDILIQNLLAYRKNKPMINVVDINREY